MYITLKQLDNIRKEGIFQQTDNSMSDAENTTSTWKVENILESMSLKSLVSD